MSQRQRQKSQSRQRIVHAAVQILRREGLTDTSVSQVMAGADLTVGGFYAHFPSKEELVKAAVRQALSDRRDLFLAQPDREGWRVRLQSALAAYFSQRHRDDAEHRCPMPMAAIDAARSGVAANTFVEELAQMAEAFEAGSALDNPRAPREAALGSLALMVGGMILAHAAKGTELSDEILQAAREFGDAALHGLDKGDQA